LAAALTIWRFGRQNAERLTVGRPLGSYSDWERWCRDPLLTLDCRDPVDRVEVLAAADPRRQDIAGIFIAWHEKHGQAPMLAAPSARGGGEAPRSEARARRGRSAAADQAAACQLEGVRLAGFEFRIDKDPKRQREPATYTLRDVDRERG